MSQSERRPAAADDVARRLATAGLPTGLSEVPLPGGEGSTWVADLPPGDLVTIWSAARSALAPLGLYPVATTTWYREDWVAADLFNRFYYGDDCTTPGAVIARAEQLSVEQALGHFEVPDDWARDNWDEVVKAYLDASERAYGRRPERALVAAVPPGDDVALERRLLAWEEALRPTEPPKISGSFGWYDPGPSEPTGLVLLPLVQPCHAPAYLSFYGAEGPGGHEALIRLMCSWQESYGAELVANWGTMLQFVAARPPTTLDAAFDLASQHVRVASCTVGLPGEGVRDLARHLWCGQRWFLHERP